jgi:hypothetical protein
MALASAGLTGCDTDPLDREAFGTPALAYSSSSEDAVILFREPGAGVPALPAEGCTYQIFRDGNMISSGTITLAAGMLTFHCGAYGGFTAQISGDSITFTGNVKKDDGSQTTIPGSITRERDTGADPFPGVWYGFADHESTLTLSQGAWAYANNQGRRENGVYTRMGKTAAFWYSGKNLPHATTIVNNRIHTQDVEFINNRLPR